MQLIRAPLLAASLAALQAVSAVYYAQVSTIAHNCAD